MVSYQAEQLRAILPIKINIIGIHLTVSKIARVEISTGVWPGLSAGVFHLTILKKAKVLQTKGDSPKNRKSVFNAIGFHPSYANVSVIHHFPGIHFDVIWVFLDFGSDKISEFRFQPGRQVQRGTLSEFRKKGFVILPDDENFPVENH